jgi:hypothetical protein
LHEIGPQAQAERFAEIAAGAVGVFNGELRRLPCGRPSRQITMRMTT